MDIGHVVQTNLDQNIWHSQGWQNHEYQWCGIGYGYHRTGKTQDRVDDWAKGEGHDQIDGEHVIPYAVEDTSDRGHVKQPHGIMKDLAEEGTKEHSGRPNSSWSHAESTDHL